MNSYKCKGCGIELTALNMSEDETYCKKCFDEIVAGMDTEDESPETRWLKDREMDEIIVSPCPQLHESQPHLQRMRRLKGY